MITFTGRPVWPKWCPHPDEPRDVAPSLTDIAVGLGRMPRFAGQTREFYTVLCHSLACSQAASRLFPDKPRIAMYLLLHDAHEAIVGDVPTPWKTEAARFDQHELQSRIECDLLLTNEVIDAADMPIAEGIDAAAVAVEAHALGHAAAEKYWPRVEFGIVERELLRITEESIAAGNPIALLHPDSAIRAFMRRFNNLRRVIGG